MRYFVYSEHLKSGKKEYLRDFSSAEDAIRHIAKCYKIDAETYALGEYYYFVVRR